MIILQDVVEYFEGLKCIILCFLAFMVTDGISSIILVFLCVCESLFFPHNLNTVALLLIFFTGCHDSCLSYVISVQNSKFFLHLNVYFFLRVLVILLQVSVSRLHKLLMFSTFLGQFGHVY